jgi:hypothetical protein
MKILQIAFSVTVRDIEIAIHNCFEYVILDLFISDFKEIAKITRQVHVVDNLRAKFFMRMNILESEEMILNLQRRKLVLSLCESLKVNIRVISRFDQFKVDRVVLIERLISISAKFIASVSIKMKDSLSNRNYLFQFISRGLNLEQIDDVMTHMINADLTSVQVCNFTNKSVVVSRRARLDRIIEYEKHECYVIDSIETSLVAESI